MKKFLKDITGITKKEKELEEKELEVLKKSDPKEYATRRKEPWVSVLDVKVNEDNVRNGFFELDWNNEFIEELIDAGYQGEKPEDIVDAWFKTIAMQILGEQGLDTAREMGYINVVPIDKGKSSVS